MEKLANLDELPEGGILESKLREDSVVVLRLGADVHAYLNICPHAGRALNWAPGKFLYGHGQLVCAAHGAAFRPEDGMCIGGPCRGSQLVRVPTQVEDGVIWAQ